MTQLFTWPSPMFYVFSDEDRARLFRIGPLFDVLPVELLDGSVLVQVKDGAVVRSALLPGCVAHVRVLTEICEKTIRWVYFHEGEHCAVSLLRLPDARLLRLAELYREKGGLFPDASAESAESAPAGPAL